jgi:crotonobetainyl-CoA:carnitine CoA-transferase CaiB-like acyl-CoA transferase
VAENGTRPFDGIRVVDFSWIVAGPQCTRIMADLGADVIRVENESYLDSMRNGMQVYPDRPSLNGSGMFNNMSRNKRSVTANVYHPGGREMVERLIQNADVVLENFSAGAFERMGFGFDHLRELNPSIIYISLSGFGHEGIDTTYITWGPTAQAVSGSTFMSGFPDMPPAGWGYSYLDHTGGYYGAIALMQALYHRKKTGQGQYIDLAQCETGMMMGGVAMLDYQVNNRRYVRQGNHSRWPAVAPHSVYRCSGDDRWIAISVETDAQWQALCAVLNANDLATDPLFATNLARVQQQETLDARVEEYTRQWDKRELMYLLQAAGVPAGAAQNQQDKMEFDPQLKARDFYAAAEHSYLGTRRFEGLPIKFSRSLSNVRRGAPEFGEHTEAVMTELLGYSNDEFAALKAEVAV